MKKSEIAYALEKRNTLKYSYIVLMNMNKDDLQRVYDREFKVTVVAEPERLYDSRGNVAKVMVVGEETVEPYDPAYLGDEEEEADILSSFEKRYYKRIKLLENKLRKAKIRFDWNSRFDCFIVKKFKNGSDYPVIKNIWVDTDDWTYCFGSDDAEVYDSNLSLILDKVMSWLGEK